MNAKSWSKLELLVARCEQSLREGRQSTTIFRGEMWAIVSAHHDIAKARGKQAVASGRALPDAETRTHAPSAGEQNS